MYSPIPRDLGQMFNATTDSSCTIFQCNNTDLTQQESVGDIFNPFMFFTNNQSLCNYANITVCCNLTSQQSSFTGFLKPFCLDLLPFCIFYSFMRVIISFVNYIFIYKKKIEKEALGDNYQLIGPDGTSKKDIKQLKGILRFSFITDIVNALISFALFKGYQFYASYFSAPSVPTAQDKDAFYNLLLLGNMNPAEGADNTKVYIFFAMSLIWYVSEACLVYIQIFAVSTLTHLDNLIKESLRKNEAQFYKKHEKWAMTWAIIFFTIGAILLTLNFFWVDWKDGDLTFNNYKLFYKYFSTSTVTFWLCYTLVLILVLTDRLLSYEGFKKREDFRNENRRSSQSSNLLEPVRNYQIIPNSTVYSNIVQSLKDKFPDKSSDDIQTLAKSISNRYNEKMNDHFDTLRDKIKDYIDEPGTIETSMSYVKYLRIFNGFILLGYVLVLISYENSEDSDSDTALGTRLSWYLIGFIISSVATFAYELTHNYLLYRSYFLQILTKVKSNRESSNY